MNVRKLVKRAGILSASMLGVVVYAQLSLGLVQQGVGERAGQAVDDAGRGIRRGVQNAFPRARALVHEQELISRVYSRIHWDRMLVGSTIDLDVAADGTVVLRGSVPDSPAKERAVVLARDTVGVTRVVDELAVLRPSGARVIVPADPTPLPTTSTRIR